MGERCSPYYIEIGTTLFRFGVQGVAKAVAEQVESEHRDGYRRAGKQKGPRRGQYRARRYIDPHSAVGGCRCRTETRVPPSQVPPSLCPAWPATSGAR